MTASTVPIVVDSVTQLGPAARGAVVVCGSHGGVFAADYAARLGVRGIVFNDAGVGKDRAGVAGLDSLARLGIPAVAVLTASAVIGDGADTCRRGVVGHVNRPAGALGCQVGASASGAAAALAAAQPAAVAAVGPVEEARHLLLPGTPPVWALDSASLARAGDDGAVVVTGSHANLLGGRPESALKCDALLALYNDAGVDPADGCTRLPALEARGVAAGAVAADSARIGDARSTYEDGILSAVNGPAVELGARVGMTARELVSMVRDRVRAVTA